RGGLADEHGERQDVSCGTPRTGRAAGVVARELSWSRFCFGVAANLKTHYTSSHKCRSIQARNHETHETTKRSNQFLFRGFVVSRFRACSEFVRQVLESDFQRKLQLPHRHRGSCLADGAKRTGGRY